jgi:hypothetical protein
MGALLPAATSNHRFAIYAALNIAFILAAGIACLISGSQSPRVLYLGLLFALCSTPLIDLDGLNGRYSLLAIFLLMYFVMYGVGDLGALMQPTVIKTSMSGLSSTDAVILVGGAILVLSYRLVVSVNSAIGGAPSRHDWPVRAILLAGFSMWAIGTYATYDWYVHIVTAQTNEALRKGLQSHNTYALSAYILAQMMQPLGILLIAYAWRRYRLYSLLPIILFIVVLQVILGFIVDLKALAMYGGILAIVTFVLIDGRVPKVWLAGALAYVILVFPIFQAYRAEVSHNRGIARTNVVQNLGKTLELVLSVKDRVSKGPDRADTFWERSSLRGSVQMIVEHTGKDVPFEGGYTLTPIFAAFIPKIVWPDKPDIPTGQIINKVFHVSDTDDLFVSPSHLGELYWNFGWPGVLGGMTIIGGILGFVGSRFNLAEEKTVTRLLVTVVTIKLLIVSFEAAIAPIYVVWLRSLAAIGILHLIFARVPVSAQWFSRGDSIERKRPPGAPGSDKLFPHLLS